MPSPVLIAKPATPQWQPSHRLGVGLKFACIFDSPGITHRNIVGRGVSDVEMINATMTNGAYGPTAQFGSGTYAKASRSSSTQPTGGYTVAVLCRANGTPSGTLPILACASVAPVDATWYLGVSGGLPRFARRNISNSYDVAAAGSYTWGSDYHLIAGTTVPANNADTSGSLLLHANGRRIATGTYAAAPSAYTAGPLLIGSLYDSTSNSATAWPGDIAAVYIWRRSLSDAEHAALAADPFAPVRPRPRAWFSLAVTTLDATAQAASASLSAAVSIPGTLGASSQAATTSLAATVNLTATLGATAEAAATAIAGQVAIPATLGATAAEATVDLEGFWGVPLEITATATAAHTSLRVRWGRTPPASDQTDLIRVGLSLLTQTLKATASQPVTYVRGLDSVDVRATFGRKLLKLDDGAGGIRMEWTDMDFLIPSADLVIGGESITPQRGDRVFMLAGENVQEFEVMPFGSDPAWIWSDPHQSMFRIHAKHIGSEPYDL